MLTRAVQCCQRLAPNRDRQGADVDFCNLVLVYEAIFSNFAALPPRIACLSALLKLGVPRM